MDTRTKAIIATLLLAVFMIGSDFTGVMILVVQIEQDFSADVTTAQWMINAFALLGLIVALCLDDAKLRGLAPQRAGA